MPPTNLIRDLKVLFKSDDSTFEEKLRVSISQIHDHRSLISLNNIRKRYFSERKTSNECPNLKIALLGGYTFHPLKDYLELFFWEKGFETEIYIGDFDNYTQEILNAESSLYTFHPNAVIIIPNENECKYRGNYLDSFENTQSNAEQTALNLIELTNYLHQRMTADIIITNYMLFAEMDWGRIRSKLSASEWTYRKLINLELGLKAPEYLKICDIEFLSASIGTNFCWDPKNWFQSKQLGSVRFQISLARELAFIGINMKVPCKKVLVLDLDNTLWGGVIGDDGLMGIDIGPPSATGEAYKSFQEYIKSLKDRGILLAVCSKNFDDVAKKPFKEHPEMVLSLDDIVSFKATWGSKADSIKEISEELNLGADSFVFVDDNPAEIEIINQFLPEVETILLSADPAFHRQSIQNSRLFETDTISTEDLVKTSLYKQELKRKSSRSLNSNLSDYLNSLEMKISFNLFQAVDFQRITQLVNKSNQFNLTTIRRTSAEINSLAKSNKHFCFSVRLKDKFGDHGLISVIILKKNKDDLDIDTWLMSCRVLERGVECEVLNEIVRLSVENKCGKIKGMYVQSEKNRLVENHYDKLGFDLESEIDGKKTYSLIVQNAKNLRTQITQ